MKKRTLFDYELMALKMGLGGARITDETFCKKICDKFYKAFQTHDNLKLATILSQYILQVKIMYTVDRTYIPDTSILIKYETKTDNLHFAFESGEAHDIKIRSLKDFDPFFEVFSIQEPDLVFCTCGVFTNEF